MTTHDEPIRVPLRNRDGHVAAHALLDAVDAHLAEHRWHTHPKTRLVSRSVKGRLIYMHREVMGLAPNDSLRIDHINRDPHDNRRRNLRLATVAQNAQNQGSRGGTSRYRGVNWDKSRNKWVASAMLNGRRRTVGRFGSEDEAHAAIVAWRQEHMPFSQEAAGANNNLGRGRVERPGPDVRTSRPRPEQLAREASLNWCARVLIAVAAELVAAAIARHIGQAGAPAERTCDE